MTTVRAGGSTHVGQIRSLNEDSFLILDTADLYAVADGMGGHQGGEVASAMAVELLERHAGAPSLENLKQAARLGNRAIFEQAGGDAGLRGMGTTLCAVRVVPGPEGDEIAWINVGDSRVYLYRDDALLQLSRDHSLVEDLLRDGQLTPDEAAVHPKRNIITRALGIDVDVDVDGATVIPFNGDRFVLCSDGLFGEVSDDQIAAVLRRLADPTEAADELVRLANESGGRDNITVVVVEVVDDDGRAAAAAAAMAAEQARLAEREAERAAGGDVDDEPDTVPVDDEIVFADRRSSLPEADDDYGAESDDPFADLDRVSAKRFTWRVALFVLVLLGLVAVVLGAFVYNDRTNYHVAFDGEQVVLYQGTPDGVLGLFGPVRDRELDLTADELSSSDRDDVEDLRTFSSLGQARRWEREATQFVIEAERAEAATTTTTTTTSTTTTTAPTTTTTAPVTTTTAGPGGP